MTLTLTLRTDPPARVFAAPLIPELLRGLNASAVAALLLRCGGETVAVGAMRGEGIALPFPGGIVRSGSKVGSLRSKSMPASTNHQMAPTLRAQVEDTLVPDGVGAMFEIVIDGVSEDAVREAMRRGLHAAAAAGASHVTAANFGGKLGEFHFPLDELRDPP